MSSTKLAFAIPLALGIACSTTGQSASRTGAMWTLYEPSDGSQPSDRPPRGTGADVAPAPRDATAGLSVMPVAGSTDSGATGSSGSTGSSDSSSSGSPGSSGSSGSMGSSGSADTGSPGSGGAMGPGGASDTMGSGSAQGGGSDSSATGSSDHAHGAASGSGDVMAHSDDQMVRGKVSKVSKDEIAITAKGGEARTLKIRPETVVTINGKDAKPSQLKQGQMVRASFSNQGGDDVAVKIEAGKARQAKSGAGGGKMKGHHGDAQGHGTGGASGGSR